MPAIRPAHPKVTMSSMAAVLSLMLGLQLAAGGGFLGALFSGELPYATCVMLGLTMMFSSAAIISSFSATIQPQSARIASAAGSAALAFSSAIDVNHSVHHLSETSYFALSLAGQVAYVYAYFFFMGQLLKISGLWTQLPQRVASGALALVGGFGFLAQSWVPLATFHQVTSMARDIILSAGPLMMALAFGQIKTLRLVPQSILGSIRLRLPAGPEHSATRKALLIGALGAVASLGLNIAWSLSDHDGSTLIGRILTVFSFSWFGCMYFSLDGLRTVSREQHHSLLSAKLAPASALRFLTRYEGQRKNWAATIGLKTANFMIDHDPGTQLQAVLPASILQIRSEEIQRCVNAVLGPLELHSSAASNLVSGAIDPEPAVRPCIDALKMFACLYLDAGPLVERRIKGLVSLLPIVDPGLAQVVDKVNVASLIRRNQWFFHFDFDWIDQHMTQTANRARYDVQIATLPSPLRNAMLDYLAKHGGIGNFVWLGPQARERLLQEAPAMHSVLEPCPIPVGGAGGVQVLMFIVRFEQLIPRLQRYFDLDTMRQALFDFEPSDASYRIHRLLTLQLNNAQTATDIAQVLAQISSVAWRGFREKDNALSLILAVHERITNSDHDLKDELLNAVRAIGYPSQILHHAQIDKIALRDIARLKAVALSPHDPRFEEAWLVLSTTDYHRHTPAQRRDFLAFLRRAGQRSQIARIPLVQIKGTDALAGLARACDSSDLDQLQETLAALYQWLARAEAEPNTLCLLLDAHIFIKGQLHQSLSLPKAATQQLRTYVKKLRQRLGDSDPQIVSLNARWLELGMDEASPEVTSLAS